MNSDEKYIQRCLQLAANGLGTTYPNPLVGCVIVLDDVIIAEGWHYKAGQAHAEVVAINLAKSKGYTTTHFSRSTLYVSLEPCSHHGKTPPCADLVIASGFKHVVIGTLDPHDKVAGNGVMKLETAGIRTTVGILEAACNELNKRFFTFHKKKRPYIILKWAQTSNGMIAPATKSVVQPVWISNTLSRKRTHKTRAQEHAILIGAKTALADNPSLTTRDWYGTSPQRFVVSNGDLPADLKLFSGENPATVFYNLQPEKIVRELYSLGIQSVIIEGGGRTIQDFIDAGLWDEAHVYIGTTVHFKNGIAAPKLVGASKLTETTNLGNDQLSTYYKQ